MHSRIFEISLNKIDKESFVTPDKFYDTFVGSIGDYVSESPDRKDDIDWLLLAIKKYGVIYNTENDTIIFSEGFKENYFKERFKEFTEAVSKITLSVFAGNDTEESEMCLYSLQQSIEKKFGFYVYDDDCYETIDSFVRRIQEGKTYYIGGIIDYHM